MHIEVTDRCAGHGRCYTLAPALFEDDDDGYGQVKGDGSFPETLRDVSLAAAEACPERAIRIEE
jgi:ferredoxin